MSSMSRSSKLKREMIVNRYCGLRAKRVTSWIAANPCRSFDSCAKRNDRYSFCVWYDVEDSPCTKKLIGGLLKMIQKLDVEMLQIRAREMKLWFFLVVSWMLLVALMMKGK